MQKRGGYMIYVVLLLLVGLKIGMSWWFYTILGLIFTIQAINIGIKVSQKQSIK